MTQEFSKCEACGIIFLNPGHEHTECPKCRGEKTTPAGGHDTLRLLKNTLRDVQSKGEFLTISELSARTNVPEDRIWPFIHAGEIDTASFDDPKVRDFLVRKRREQAKAARQRPDPAAPNKGTASEAQKKTAGFHRKADDDSRH